MSLQPVGDTPGLWADPHWRPGHPGTFALVIGVSRYPHLDGGGAETPVTEIPPRALAGIRPELSPEQGQVTRGGTLGLPESLVRSAASRGAELEQLLSKTLSVSHRMPAPVELALDGAALSRVDPTLVEALFGAPSITALWTRQARLLALSSRTEPAAGRVQLEQVQRDPTARSFRIYLQAAAEPRGYWLEVGTGDATHGLLLPTFGEPVSYQIEAEIATIGGEASFARLEATLASGNAGALGEAARLWEQYATTDVEAAINGIDLGALRAAVLGKNSSPLAAAVAALVLLRIDRLDLIHDWLGNLADWFPQLPDGAVLWAEQQMRQRTDRPQAIADAAASLCRLDERGLPFTSEALSYAAALAARLDRAGDQVPPGLRERLDRVRAQIDEALVYFRPGGLFTAYAGFDDDALRRLLPPTGAPRR